MDAEEAERRSQILVMTSDEIFEAQHRVKLLSFLLLIICSMELLTLFTILVGVPDDDSSDSSNNGGYGPPPPLDPNDPGSNHNHGNNSDNMRTTWQNSDYADVVVQAFGFWVATLGLRATTENTGVLAKRYMYLLFVAGMAWNAYYYYMNLTALQDAQNNDNHDTNNNSGSHNSHHNNNHTDHEDEEDEESGIGFDEDLYTAAFMNMFIPIMIWIICCVRAY